MDNTSNINQEKGSTSRIAATKTSQTEWSRPEGVGGTSDGANTIDSRNTEGGQGRGSFTQTSQQAAGELSIPESENR